jgi:hypothetical protein
MYTDEPDLPIIRFINSIETVLSHVVKFIGFLPEGESDEEFSAFLLILFVLVVLPIYWTIKIILLLLKKLIIILDK